MSETKTKEKKSLDCIPTTVSIDVATTEDLVAHFSKRMKEALNYSWERKDWCEETADMLSELYQRFPNTASVMEAVYKERHPEDDT
ncbi:hypothetical protein LCGC14_2263010 [marine sediment metagenome]|uniref:Uncharacterized protein n=1 Tax=marine sediment metagenome TaxID=412755 RepID=A0A0F9DLG3_9ZZZZ